MLRGTARSPTPVSRMLSSISWQNWSNSPWPSARLAARLALQATQKQHGMEHDHLQSAVNRIWHTIDLVKGGQARLCHDRAIETRDGTLLRGVAKQLQYHGVSSAAQARCRDRQGNRDSADDVDAPAPASMTGDHELDEWTDPFVPHSGCPHCGDGGILHAARRLLFGDLSTRLHRARRGARANPDRFHPRTGLDRARHAINGRDREW